MPFPFRAVIFDLDGTLVDSLADIGWSMNEALKAHSLPTHPLERYRDMVGEGIDVLVSRALPVEHRHLLAEVVSEYRAIYARHYADRSRPYAGITELLEALDAHSVRLAVLSNKREDFTVALVRELLPTARFEVVRGQRPDVPRKPDPTAALQIAASIGVPPDAFAFVGDTRIDMLTARAAGMLPVGVTWGFRSRAELLEGGARFLIENPLELLELSQGEP